MPFPIIAYAIGAAAVAVTGATVAYFSSDEEKAKPKPKPKSSSKTKPNPSSSNNYKKEERKRKIAKFDREVSEYIKNEKIRLVNKHCVNKSCIIQKGQYRVESHTEELFKANTRIKVDKLKNEITDIDNTIIKLKEWKSNHA